MIDYRIEKKHRDEQIKKLIENMSDAVVVYDNHFKINLWNNKAEEIFGIKKSNIIGTIISPDKISDKEFIIITQTIFPSLAPSVIKRTLPGEYPQIMDISFSRPTLEITVSTNRILDKYNNPVGFMKIIKNRTREVELLRSKSEFITVAAHQLRTPLTAVNWIFETLSKDESFNNSNKELITNGLLSSIKLLKIVNDLLDISKIESGKFGYNFTEIDLCVFITDIVKNANLLAKKYGIIIYFNHPKSPIIIYGDSQRLGIALSNILDNAIKYNIKNGQVIISIENVINNPYIQLTIKDTGVGMSKEVLSKLFTKFFRGENIVKDHTEGSGLGLYIAKNIILRHGGNINVESFIGRGSSFLITLPKDKALIPPKEVFIE